MKGLVLSGGAGTRLRPITHTRAKQLVPVAGRPVLFYGLEGMRGRHREVGIVVGETHEEIRAAVGDGSQFGLEVTYLEQDAPRARARGPDRGGVPRRRAVLHVPRRQPAARRPQGLVDTLPRATADAMILLQEVPNPSKYGVAELNGDGRVTRLVEKPKEPRSDLALVGVYLFTPAVFDAAKALEPSWRGELEITDAIQGLVDAGRVVEPHVVHRLVEGHRPPGGHAGGQPADPRRARGAQRGHRHRHPARRAVCDRRGRRLERCHVRGPAVIGPRSVVRDAYIGPYTALSEDVSVERAEIEHSIVMERSRDRRPRRTPRGLADRRGRHHHALRRSAQGAPDHGRRPLADRDPVSRALLVTGAAARSAARAPASSPSAATRCWPAIEPRST